MAAEYDPGIPPPPRMVAGSNANTNIVSVPVRRKVKLEIDYEKADDLYMGARFIFDCCK